MKRNGVFFWLCLINFVLIISCVPIKYVHDDPRFSFEYPAGFISIPPFFENVVVHLEWKYQKAPFFAASVEDKPKDVTLEDIPQRFVDLIKGPQADITLLEQKKVTLSDGTDAITATYKWRIKDTLIPVLQTSRISVIKEDKIISVSGTSSTLGGYHIDRYMSLEEMMGYCLTLKLNS